MAESTVQELALRLRDGKGGNGKLPRFALFLGAGASIESGIPGTEAMIRFFREKLEERRKAEGETRRLRTWVCARYGWDAKASEYSNLFEAFEPTENARARHIEELVSSSRPAFGYFCLAQLLAGGYLNTVLTTNFDDLVYEASAMWSGVRPRVYTYGAITEAIRHEVGRPTILKLHGDFLYSGLKNTGSEVARVDPNMKTEILRVLNGPERYELLVSGYSGGDDSIMTILETVPDSRALFWCTYRNSNPNKRVEALLQRPNVFRVKTEGFNSLMDELLNTVGFTLPDLEQTVREQLEDIVSIISDSKSPNLGQYLIRTQESLRAESSSVTDTEAGAGRVWLSAMVDGTLALNAGDFKTAVEAFRNADERNPPALLRLGAALHLDGQTEDAVDVLRRAIQLNPNDYEVLNALGTALLDTDHVDEATAMFRRARELDPTDVTKMNGLAIALRAAGERDEADTLFREVIAQTTEDPRRAPHRLMNRGPALIAHEHEQEGLSALRELTAPVVYSRYTLSLAEEALRRFARYGIPDASGEAIAVIQEALAK